MSLRIRCPHCQHVLVVDHDLAGTPMHCPECRRGLTVPQSRAATPAARDVGRHCPRCRSSVAPGTAYCPKCLTDLASGRRLPLMRRLQHVRLRTWAIAAACLIVAAVGGRFGYEKYHQHRLRNADVLAVESPATAAIDATGVGRDAVARLLNAKDAGARRLAMEEVAGLAPRSLPTLAGALREIALPLRSTERARSVAVALDLLARSGDVRWLETVRHFDKAAEIREPLLIARARLGDASATDELCKLWVDEKRRQLALEALAKSSAADARPGIEQAATRSQQRAERIAAGLRKLGESETSTMMDRLLDRYWDSLSWLGQDLDERYAAEVWELAKPPTEKDLDFKWRVRAARKVLDRASQQASPSARAAAGLVLTHSGPQYETLRKEIVGTLARILPECSPVEQQRLTWALSRLASQKFASITASSTPADVDRLAVAAALDWARSSGVTAAPLRTARESYRPAPLLSRRVVTPRRQLERDLLVGLERDWGSAARALERWRAEKLGFTKRIEERMHPGQASPSYPALCAAFQLAAEAHDPSQRERLVLWTQATDQPAWVRGMATVAVAALDARRGAIATNWAAKLTPAMFESRPGEGPTLDDWGRVIAAGGTALTKSLQSTGGSTLPAALRTRLVKAAESARGQ